MPIVQCSYCQIQFYKKPSRSNSLNHFCKMKCYKFFSKENKKITTATCVQCLKVFKRKSSEIRSLTPTCGNACKFVFQKKSNVDCYLNCSFCLKEFYTIRENQVTSKNPTCSESCRLAIMKKNSNLISKKCNACNKVFKKRPDILLKFKNSGLYCSRKCRNDPRTLEEKFWENIIKGNHEKDCWDWKGTKNKNYSYFCYRNNTIRAHKCSYELHFGPIPDKLWILHKCDNPSCCNPLHLYAGTPMENTLDRLDKTRWAEFNGRSLASQP